MSKRIGIEDVRTMFEQNGYLLISTQYKSTHEKLETLCPCGHTYHVSRSNFKKGNRCSICSGRIVSYDNVKTLIESEDYVLLEKEYVNNTTPMKMICPCGHSCEINYASFKKGVRCNICSGNRKLTKEDVINRFEDEGYIIKNDFELENGNHTKIKVFCSLGHEWEVRIDAFFSGQRCPQCGIKSKGEREIMRVLEKYGVEYTIQKTFDDCKLKRLLPFDIYIPLFNTCIEYDGIEHYRPTTFGGTYTKEQLQERFEKRIICDHIKTTYCKKNNIQLIRIPYWEMQNIEKILKSQLNI